MAKHRELFSYADGPQQDQDMARLPSGLTRLEYYKRRYRRAFSIATQWYSLQETCYHYCVPSRDLFYYTNQTQGAQKNIKVYDTTAVAATRKFVAKIQNALTPPQQVWALLEAGSEIEETDQDTVNKYLQDATNKIFDFIRHSNFDLAIHECYFDLAIGTAILQVNEGPDSNPLLFYSVPLAQICFEESINGYIESSYRTWGEVKMTEIEIMWPNANIPSWMQEQMREDPNATVKALYEGNVYVHGDKKPYKYILWIDSEILIEEEDVSPKWIVFRWSKVNNEVMGRGVIMDALPSILSLNELFRLELTSANFNVCRPLMGYSDGIFNPWTFVIQPNTIIPIAPSSSGQPPIIPFPPTENPNFEMVTADDLRQQINTLMFGDPIGPIDSPQKTATEQAIRQRNMTEELGPVAVRLQQEFLARLIQRIMHILKQKGLMQPLLINGHEIQVRYQSPFTLAQGAQDVNTFNDFYARLQGIYGPQVPMTMINTPALVPWMAAKLGIDKSLIPSKEQIEAFMEAQIQQQQALQEQQQQQALGESANGGNG